MYTAGFNLSNGHNSRVLNSVTSQVNGHEDAQSKQFHFSPHSIIYFVLCVLQTPISK
jgi:hypothetical protein